MCILKLIARPLFTPRLPRLLCAHFRPPSKVSVTRGSSQRVTRLADIERSTGANYHFGLRVIQSTSTPTSPHHAKRLSLHSSREAVEYVIWRRWEDCLDFQRTLEVEYSAVSKRRRKGEPALNHHAKDMLYPSQRAASFESLPLGPDPSTIPVDVHAHIPRLSKKSTIFRMNEAIIQQRGEEVKAMIEALFDEDAPSTLQELRTVITVRDFFGYWWRDKEADRKMGRTPAFNSATLPPSRQGKGGDFPKQSTVVTPELIAFATGGKIAGRSKLKQPPTRRPSQTPSNGSREALHSPSYEPSRPTTPAFAQVASPHTPFFGSAAVTGGESQRRQPPSYRPAEGTMLFRSPALPHMPVLDSPGPFSPYADPLTSPLHSNGSSHQSRQRSLPQNVPTGSPPSHYLPPGGNFLSGSVPLMHPMQGRTASMPSPRRRRDRTADQVLPGPIPRKRNDAIDTSGNRSARIFGASTGVVNSPPPITTSISEGERGNKLSARHQRDLQWRGSRSQVDLTLSSVALPHHIESQQSYGSSDTSITSTAQTLRSSDHSTSITTSQSSQHSSTAVQGHRSVPSWSLRRMSLDSLAPTDLGPSTKDKSRSRVTQGLDPRHSVSSDSSHTDSSDAAPVYPPFSSMPSLLHPSKLQPGSASQPPTPTPPRPPRSALRLSSTLSRATSSPANSPLTPAEDGGAAVTVDIERTRTNDEIILSYLRMSKSEDPFELEFRPQPPTTAAHRARGTAAHVVQPPPQPDSIAPIPAAEMSPTSPVTPLVGATTTIKAVHEASGTIIIFRVPRMSTSLADLRKKLSRKFMDAENIKIPPEQLELRCLSPVSAVPNVANRPTAGGAGHDGGATSTHGAHGLWLPLNTEADWHMAAANTSGKITVKVF